MKHKLKDMHIRRMELMGRENVTRANHKSTKYLMLILTQINPSQSLRILKTI